MNLETVDRNLTRARTLPADNYLRVPILEAEWTGVFGASWQLVGRSDQVARPGSFLTAAAGREPVLVVRAADGVLRALSNVCRHRAGPVATASHGECRAFRCGYHGWSYALDGKLLGTPEFEGVEDFRKEEVALPAFAVAEWLGLVFVSAAPPGGPSFDEYLGPLRARLEKRGLSEMRFVRRKSWELSANWKVYVDNYLEGYHIPVVHPALMKELDYARYETKTDVWWSEQVSPVRANAPGRIRTTAGESGNEAEYFWLFPNLMLNVYPDNFSTNLILPLGPDKTLTVFDWYFRDPGSSATEKLVDETVAFSDEIQVEDIGICEAVQRGLASRTYDRGRYSVKRENGVHHFHRLWADAMRREVP